METLRWSALWILCLALSFSACKKEELIEGPQGEQGLRGEQGSRGERGEQGPEGPQGEQGEPGTANVLATGWLNTGGGWANLWGTLTHTLSTVYVNEIVEATGAASLYDFVNNNGGTLLVYFRGTNTTTGTTAVGSVPGRFIGGSNQYDLRNWDVKENLENRINIAVAQTSGANERPDIQIRLVLIPAGVTMGGATQSVLSEGRTWQTLSYQELSTHFNIKD